MQDQTTAPDGPDLSVVLPEVEYSTEAQEFIDKLVYRFPSCNGCPVK